MQSSSSSLRDIRFSLVGPGRVGSSLARWAAQRGARLVAVAGRSPDSGEQLAGELSGVHLALEQMDSSRDDLLLVAVSDAALQEVAHQLARRTQSSVVLHTSGRADATVLSELRHRGSAVGCLHPLKAFPDVICDLGEAKGTVFALDGDPAACRLAERLARAWAGVPTLVPADKRPLYHLGATLAAGGVVTLLASACELAARLGLPHEIARGYLQLARGAVAQAEASDDITTAITGPVARGDLAGFAEQVAQLRPLDPELADLVDRLARRTIRHCASRAGD